MSHNDHATAVLTTAGHGDIIAEAKQVGITPAAILALLIKFGPVALEMLRVLIDALKAKPA